MCGGAKELVFRFAGKGGGEAGRADPAPRRAGGAPKRNQIQFLMEDLDARLPEDHQARATWDFLDRLDLSAFYASIRDLKSLIHNRPHSAAKMNLQENSEDSRRPTTL